jgi:preprotein translocase subunit SecA
MLQIIDKLWVEHLTTMERERIQASWQTLRQMKSADAYKMSGHQQFGQLKENIQREVANVIFHVSLMQRSDKAPQSPMTKANMGSKGDSNPKAASGNQKVGRTDPCPCGSGKKYKHCHGK